MRSKIIIMATLALAACSSTLQPAALNPATGYFPTRSKIIKGGAVVTAPFDAKYANILYVKTDSKSDKFNGFYVTTFKNMNKFNHVYTKNELEELVIQKGLSGKVQNVSDLIGLKNLSDAIGPVLVAEPIVEHLGGYNWSTTLKVIDAQDGKEVLSITNTAFNFSGLDDPLFYPVFNGFLSWVNGQPIETQ